MDFINEYALLFAVASPVVVIIGMQVALFIAGERGTGLLPGLGAYPSIEFRRKPGQVVAMPAPAKAREHSANDAEERQAA